MEDLADRDIEGALIALKKGAQLLKYGRKGNPKIYPFRLSDDGTSLIWISSSGERRLKLASVSRIIAGQRTVRFLNRCVMIIICFVMNWLKIYVPFSFIICSTSNIPSSVIMILLNLCQAVFQRNLHTEKEKLAFSIIYNDGKQTLDLICKDKVEAEIWTEGLKTLISSRQAGRSKIDGWCDEGLYFDENRHSTLNCPTASSLKSYRPDNSFRSDRSYVALGETNMQVKGSGSDALRVSISSVPSNSSHGSAPDDCDASGDVYIWGEVLCDNVVKVGPEKNATAISTRADVLLPKPLECCIVLDVHHVACGVRHATLVTRQGEVFSWGEESGGRLGHGVGKNVSQPRLIESLYFCSVDLVACGEFHSCAVTMSGELYTWGDGTHNAGILGLGTDICHWIPKRVSGPLEGLRVAKVTCGTWHTALITSTGQLFTFGDGTFGALGHGNRENILYPREVESLSGLRSIAVACGVWHTAAVVEVIVTQSSANVASGKLFTWGDGDKNRLGHGDKEPRLNPTCVSGLIDYNLHKIGCGHSLTVALTTSGLVFTMGSTVYGQLGNPQSDGKMPCMVEGNITGEYVEEISCGAYHVAVLTSKNEVFTWGKGTNGRLGHGDVEDRKTPTVLEALKDRHVKFIACGANYSAAICLHKWVSGAEQSQCSACRQAFGFTRKRHNCYNCGLVHCHSCSSRKAIRAVLAPNPSKPHRVCDSCFTKLSKLEELGSNSLKYGISGVSGENKDRLDKADLWLAKSSMPSLNFDLIKQLDTKAAKQGKKSDTFSLGGSSQVSLSQLRDAVMSTNFAVHRSVQKSVLSPSNVSSRSVSPFSTKASPPRSATPVPTTSGLSFSKSINESLKKTNELLNQEVHRLRAQVENLRLRCEKQESEIQNSARKAQEAMILAAEESAKCNAAKEVIKSLAAQLKDMAERLPPGAYDPESLKLVYLPNGPHYRGANGERISRANSINGSHSVSYPRNDSNLPNGILGYPEFSGNTMETNENHCSATPGLGLAISKETTDRSEESGHYKLGENVLKSTNSETPGNANHQVEAEWIEQYEPGVYTTLVTLRDGTRDLKRVRFSRRRFGEHQAELWWSENREKVYERYNIRVSSDKSSAGQRQEGAFSPSSQF